MTTEIKTKRIYEPADEADGCRVLVDRLWPRGVAKQAAAVDVWAKDVTPTSELRRAYHGGVIDGPQFAERYRTELATNPAWPDFVERMRCEPVVTMLTAVKEVAQSHVPVLVAELTAALE